MTIVVGYTSTPAGGAALDRAIAEALAHGEPLLVVNVSSGERYGDPSVATDDELEEVRRILSAAGVRGEVKQLARGRDVTEELSELCDEVGASTVVIGLRRRTPVGKLVLGSTAQQILLSLNLPVLAVKA